MSEPWAGHDGWVTIARTTESRGPGYVSVTIRSGDDDIVANLSLEDYALAVTGQARIHATVERHKVPNR